MRWLYDAPGVTGSSYCRACMQDRKEQSLCDDCPGIKHAPMPEHHDVTRLFVNCEEQWRLHEMSGMRLGLDMQGVKATAEMLGITITPDLFEKLKLLEREVISIDRDRRKDSGEEI